MESHVPPAGGGLSTRPPEIMAAMVAWAGERSRWLLLGYGGIAILVILEVNDVARRHPGAAVAIATLADTAVIVALWLVLMLRAVQGRRSRLGQAMILALAAASLALVVLSPPGAAIIGAIVALSMVANGFPGRTRNMLAAVIIAAYLVVNGIVNSFQPIATLSFGLGLGFAYLASSSVAQLRAGRDAEVQAAALNERARIAREIHDVLAHTLAALAVQLESARMMLERRQSDPEALATVERSHRLAREGLEEVSRAVAALRGDRMPAPDQVRDLVNDFEADTGVEADFKIEGAPRMLSSEAQLAVYRTAQEALTNVRKHADASRVEVALRYEAAGAELRIVDIGQAKPSSANGQGYGLLGMRERAELLGGKLEAGPTADGFQVRLWIPA